MENALRRAKIGQGVHFSSISDPKFKHNRISVNFILPLARDEVADNAVVPFLLRKGCKSLPDFTSLNARLAELYGAVLDANVSKYNGYQILEVGIDCLDNRYALAGEDLVGECADLLAEVIFDPKLTADGLFDAADVELEKQYILDTIAAEINDKRSYALAQCIAAMCEGEAVAVRSYGYPETAQAITPQSATGALRRMMDTARVEILFTGSGDAQRAKGVFAGRFGGLLRQPVDTTLIQLRDKAAQTKDATEQLDLNQAKLVMGLRCAGIEEKADADAYRLFSAMLGGTPFSKCFLNVREKLGLCYYCAARFDPSNRLMLIDSGVEFENIQKARSEILRQLEAMQRGDFTDEEVHNTKLLMKNSILTATDRLASIESWYLTQILRGRDVSPRQDMQDIDLVSREAIMKAANGVTLDTVYLLTGKGER
jgi:Predicted Zn-dependent peptidases